jgi:hypothetical protein
MKEDSQNPLGPPFVVQHFADLGTGEPFCARIMLGLPDLLDATTLPSDRVQKVKDAILLIGFEGLFPAFSHLREIRDTPSRQNLPELKRRELYNDFTCASPAG